MHNLGAVGPNAESAPRVLAREVCDQRACPSVLQLSKNINKHTPDRETRSAADGDVKGRPGIPKPLRSNFLGPSRMVQGRAEDFIPYMCPQVTHAGNSSASAGSHISLSSRNIRRHPKYQQCGAKRQPESAFSEDARELGREPAPSATCERLCSRDPDAAETSADQRAEESQSGGDGARVVLPRAQPAVRRLPERRLLLVDEPPVRETLAVALWVGVWVGLAFGGGVGALEDGVVFVCVAAGRRAYQCHCAELLQNLGAASHSSIELEQAISTRYRANSSMARLEEDFSDLRMETHSWRAGVMRCRAAEGRIRARGARPTWTSRGAGTSKGAGGRSQTPAFGLRGTVGGRWGTSRERVAGVLNRLRSGFVGLSARRDGRGVRTSGFEGRSGQGGRGAGGGTQMPAVGLSGAQRARGRGAGGRGSHSERAFGIREARQAGGMVEVQAGGDFIPNARVRASWGAGDRRAGAALHPERWHSGFERRRWGNIKGAGGRSQTPVVGLRRAQKARGWSMTEAKTDVIQNAGIRDSTGAAGGGGGGTSRGGEGVLNACGPIL
ncbi:hypothetical protein B0H13DRAFT_1918024 [Mycena leptocephala]|nr:hypothetical protein B0H13DRAFT_1918024 [Mycena leptocephala]